MGCLFGGKFRTKVFFYFFKDKNRKPFFILQATCHIWDLSNEGEYFKDILRKEKFKGDLTQ